MLDMPYRASERMPRVVSCDGEAVERRRKRRGQRLVRLRVLERLDEGEVARNLLGRRRLEEEVLRSGGGLRVGVGGFGEGGLRDRGRGGGRGRVQVLRQGAAEVDDGPRRVDGDSGEKREVLAAVCVGCEMGGGRMREEN